MTRLRRLVAPALTRCVGRPGHRDASTRAPEDGFTLIEVIVAFALAAMVFTALAIALAGGLKAVAVAKTRTRANELATAAIEDLQRFDYDHLGLCPASGSSGVTDPGTLSFQGLSPVTLNCSSTVVLEEPCTPTVGQVPKAAYSCRVLNVNYTVQRYVVWGDVGQTKKRLAVFVNWNDVVGGHQVSQQSSLRSPVQGSVVGVAPPLFVSVSASPSSIVRNTDGTNQTQLNFSAVTSGLSATDNVTASLLTINNGNAANTSIPLATVDGVNWSGSIAPGAYTFPAGSQYIVFGELRTSDGKANAAIYAPAITFCGASCSQSGLPTITATAPATVDIDPGGVLKADVNISAQTTGITTNDSVLVTFTTQAGAVTIALQPSDGTGNNWTGSIARSAGYRFQAGTQKFVFTAAQISDPASGSVGSTAAVQSGTVSFQ
jgi:type II secretory pathway pseudopilin PulG